MSSSMIFLFRSGSLRSKCLLVYKATRQHARNLGLFALVYKSAMLFLKHTSPTGKERHYDAFLAGLLGGYTVFGRTIHNSVSQQIVIYVAARVCLALAKLAVQQRHVGGGGAGVGVQDAGGGFELFGDGELRRTLVKNGWPAFASLSWAMVMYIFRWHPESVQSSLRSSMSYMWVFRLIMIRRLANVVAVMYSRIIGIRCGRCCGITNDLRTYTMKSYHIEEELRHQKRPSSDAGLWCIDQNLLPVAQKSANQESHMYRNRILVCSKKIAFRAVKTSAQYTIDFRSIYR